MHVEGQENVETKETETEVSTPGTETKAEEKTPEQKLAEAKGSETSTTQQSDTTEEGKKGEEEEGKETAAEDLTLDAVLEKVELPEGYEFDKDDPLLGEFVKALNDKEVTKADLGSRLAGLYAKAMESNVQQWLDKQAEWVDELEKDPKIGGDKLDPALEKIDSVIREYAASHGEQAAEVEKALRADFTTTGAGNNPAIVRFLHWTASQLSEGAPLSGGSTGGERSRAERMFGT